MEEYLAMMFGDCEGFVAVASKGDTWEEYQFAWPRGRNRLLRWVKDRMDHANIFICPALRSEKRRVKGDGIELDWLWADIDWEKVRDKAAVLEALRALKPALVRSGTGNNYHVYVQLTEAVSLQDHYRLNQGLRDLLEADAKHPDNSLLRLPGTYNRKGRPVEVVWKRTESRLWVPDDLVNGFPAIRDTRVVHETVVGDGTYDQVSLEGVPAYARRVGKMESDEAIDRFGSRHGAVYQVTMKLIKMGLSRDQIHTALQEFAPGLEKQDDEQGYDLHRDIDRCIARHPTLAPVEDLIVAAPEEPGVVELSDEEYVASKALEDEERLDKEADKIIWRKLVEGRARQKMALAEFVPPPDEATVLFSDALVEEPEEVAYLIHGLASIGDNVSVTGQYKSGKTLFVCNLIRSLASGSPFLGTQEVASMGASTVGFWSLEMSKNVLMDRYLRPQGMDENEASNLVIWHGRGYSIPLMSQVGRDWAIQWLRQEMTSVWVIDSFARICAMAGVESNDNDQVLALLRTLDEIKREANVSEMFLIAHTGRSFEGKDRARGATVFDDWADARWVLTRDGDIRFLKVEGRDVDLPSTSLTYNADTKHLTLGSGADTAARDHGVQAVVAIVAANPGIGKTALCAKVGELHMKGYSQMTTRSALVDEAESLGFIAGVQEPGTRGRKMAYRVVEDSEAITLDFSQVRERQNSGTGRARRRKS